MSLTEAEHVFAAADENGANDLITAFFTARPQYLTYASPGLAPATPFTGVPVIAFPGVPGGIEYRVSFAIPRLDIDPDNSGGTSPLPVGPGQLNVSTKVTITVGCRDFQSGNSDQRGHFVPISTTLGLWGRGKFVASGGMVRFNLDQVELVDVLPDSLETVLECMIRMMLQAALSNFQLPLNTLTLGSVSLLLTRGPELETNQVKVYGFVS